MTPKVFFNYGRGLLLGPLGCFDVGEIVDVPDRGEHVVTHIQADGAAYAVPPSDDVDLGKRDLVATLRFLDGGGRTNFTMPYQGPQMAAVIRGNRRRNGLPPVAEEAAA